MSMTDLVASPSYRATRGRVPVFRPLLNGEEFDIVVLEAIILLGVNAHEMATLKCTSPTLTSTEGMLNSTISFFYGQAPRTELFQGYIINVEMSSGGEAALSFGLIVLGPTKVLQTGQPRYWTNKTVPSAMRDIVNFNLLGITAHTEPFVWTSLAQTDESDLAMLRKLSNRLGWAIFSRYGVVLCWDPLKLFTEQGSYATLMSSQDQDFDASAERRLIDFTPQEASEENPDSMGKQIAYFDDNQVQVVKESGPHARHKFVSNFVIRSAEEAKIYVNASEAEESWKQKATARIWGDADIYPGMSVDVITANPTYYRSKFDGRWLVVKTQHKMDTSQFQTQLSLIRPDNKASIRHDPYESFWGIAGKPKPSLSLQEDTAVSTTRRWVSSWADPTVRSIT